MMSMMSPMIAVAVLTVPAAAIAQTAGAASTTDERRLSPAEVESVLADAAARRAAPKGPAPSDIAVVDDLPVPAPKVHGEVGFTIGTGGHRGAHGIAVYPLGENGAAAISFDFVDWGRRRVPR
jgi:hypothetical protein